MWHPKELVTLYWNTIRYTVSINTCLFTHTLKNYMLPNISVKC